MEHSKTPLSLEQRYDLLRRSLSHYLLLQVGTFVQSVGFDKVGPAMEVLTEKSAELKVQQFKKTGETGGVAAVKALSQNLAESMGETFSSDYGVEADGSSRKVFLSRCGCIESVVEMAGEYGLTSPQARSIFCASCMGGYRKAAESLGLGFKGKLSGNYGCSMAFSTK